MSINKQLKQLGRDLQRRGWRIEDRGARVAFYSPDGKTIVFAHKTPSDHRWYQNLLRDLRTGGYNQ